MNADLSILMEENLSRVWSQRDSLARLESIQQMYHADGVLYHVGDQQTGHGAINDSVRSVLEDIPSDFSFFKLKPVVINNNVGRMTWGVGPSNDLIVATGMDIAMFEEGKIKALYVFLD